MQGGAHAGQIWLRLHARRRRLRLALRLSKLGRMRSGRSGVFERLRALRAALPDDLHRGVLHDQIHELHAGLCAPPGELLLICPDSAR